MMKTKKSKIRTQLEELTNTAVVILMNVCEFEKDGRTPKGLKGIEYTRCNNGDNVELNFGFEYLGHRYDIKIKVR